jgi:hypothetical protein
MLFGATTEKLDKVARKNKKTSKKKPKKKGHGRKPAAAYTGAKKVNVSHAVSNSSRPAWVYRLPHQPSGKLSNRWPIRHILFI